MKFLNYFGKLKNGKIIVYDIYTFNNLFSLLLNKDFTHEDAIDYIFAKCELNAYVFQECIHNWAYLKLKSKKLNPQEAGRKSKLIEIILSLY